jgi:Periviscerokinin family
VLLGLYPFPRVFKNLVAQAHEWETCSLASSTFFQKASPREELPGKSGLYWSEEPPNGYELSSISAP